MLKIGLVASPDEAVSLRLEDQIRGLWAEKLHVEELTPEEIAPLLGVSPSAAQVRLHHAWQALQTLLNPHFQSGAI